MLDIASIRRNFAHALRRGCSESGCTLRLSNLGTYAVLKGEKICQDRKMCDCIIFVVDGSVVIGLVELKGKTVHASAVVEKLTNSSEIALDILDEYGDKRAENVLCHFVLHRGLDSSERRKIGRSRIRIRGKAYDIKTKRCGTSFSAVISDFKR